MQNILKWLDDNIIPVFAGFLLIFIPLYPKLPLIDILPGYIVRVRLEDFAVAFCVVLWLVWLLRGKIRFGRNPLAVPILAYLAVGFLSMISAVYITRTVPMNAIHVQKIILHYFRRIEYFSLFFVFYSTVKNIKLLKAYITIFVVTVFGVSIYGFGQKYLYWPAFSTMNREFAKGWMLYLTKHARVISTFGGHYDLAAFTMMALILLWSLFFGLKKWYIRVLISASLIVAFWTLILTASRTSFIAYIAGLTFMFFFFAFRKGLSWSIYRWFIVVTLSIVMMLSFGDLSERFTKLLRIDQRIAGIKSILLSPVGAPPTEKALFLENNPQAALAEITSKSDQPPTRTRPSDVYKDIPLMIPTSSDSSKLRKVARTYSKTAFKYDLSTAIRFDALWPMAIKGFKRNPLVGSGYSTLNKAQATDFTEAESTDNDYLRSLGETGILGFVTFFGTLVFILFIIFRNLKILRDPVLFSVAVGFSGLLFGLLVNAVYIDVFESSKVAFTFWAMTGFTLGGIRIVSSKEKKSPPMPSIPEFDKFKKGFMRKLCSFLKSDLSKILFILILAFALRVYKISTPLADWHSWRQADTSAVTRNYVKHGINILYPTYDDLSNVASGKNNPRGLRFVEFPLYNVASVIVDKIFVGRNIEFSGRLTSVFASIMALLFLFKIVKRYLGSEGAVISAFLFAILPFNIFYNRVILPEPFLIFTSLGMIYYFDRTVEVISSFKLQASSFKDKASILVYLLVSLVFAASSLLIKPFAAFLFLPMAYLWFRKFGIRLKSIVVLLLYCFVCFLPFIWWRHWIGQFPEGIPANMWLLNGDGIRFKGAFFYWLFADRLAKLILGYWGVVFLALGILYKTKEEGWFFSLWAISMLLYVTVFATGNVRHDYYQVVTIPIVVIFVTKGIMFLLGLSKEIVSKFTVYCLLFTVLLFMEMFGWYHMRDFYNINHPEIVEAGASLDRKASSKALVIAPYNGDTAFLYQTGRAGWPVLQEPIEKMIKMGAHYYVSVNFDDVTKKLIHSAMNKDPEKRKYKVVEFTDRYVIIQLVPDSKLPK